MNKAEAHRILDAVRAGVDHPERLIVDALEATGDVCELPEYPVVTVKPKGTWEMKSRGLKRAQWYEVVA